MPRGIPSVKNRVHRLERKFKTFRAGKKNKFPGYPMEFKQEVSALFDAGVDIDELLEATNVCPSTLNQWLKRASIKSVRRLEVVDKKPSPGLGTIQVYLQSGVRVEIPAASFSRKILEILKSAS